MNENKSVIAEGAATGHAHRAVGMDVVVDAIKIIDAPDGAEITHEEHRNFQIPPGRYRTGRVQEMDHFAGQARDVLD